MNSYEGVVYIVEDDASFRKSMERLIRVAGYEVETFGTASAFLTNANICYPGCLLLDVRLPDVDGLDLQQTSVRHCLLSIDRQVHQNLSDERRINANMWNICPQMRTDLNAVILGLRTVKIDELLN